MPNTEQGQNRVINLKVGAHVMMLDVGVFCVFHGPGQEAPNKSGLPGVRITRAPGVSSSMVEISTFEEDGWMGGVDGAALVRVHQGPAGVMVTTYQDPESKQEGPRLQVMRLNNDSSEKNTSKEEIKAASPNKDLKKESSDITAHIQGLGDVNGAIGNWIGEKGSQSWIEGFSINEIKGLKLSDIEYQAVLGRGWLSPWVEGGQFCGSRGMSLPILGLRARLKSNAAKQWTLRVTASFTDGTSFGPVEGSEDTLEAENLAPLEAFCIELIGSKEASKPTKKQRTRR